MPFNDNISIALPHTSLDPIRDRVIDPDDEHHWTDARDDDLAGLWAGKARQYTETFGSTHWR